MPTVTEVAPAKIISAASSHVATPPMPLMGIFTALAASHTMRTAMAWIAGPETPPVGLESMLLRVRTLRCMPLMVLMRHRASAPAASQARAISGTRTGAIFTKRGL